ncbi:M23 family metallopeptidase [Microbacterium sp. gxy059]|uniref:M23 family metallopeptidase n=1 Tax=Microbacterium sp. gxy059 TaxID=2957199 RepID=UPI003D972CF5
MIPDSAAEGLPSPAPRPAGSPLPSRRELRRTRSAETAHGVSAEAAASADVAPAGSDAHDRAHAAGAQSEPAASESTTRTTSAPHAEAPSAQAADAEAPSADATDAADPAGDPLVEAMRRRPASTPRRDRRPRAARRPRVRTTASVIAAGFLIAGTAVPALALGGFDGPVAALSAQTATSAPIADGEAQTFATDAERDGGSPTGSAYAATSPEEIEEMHAEVAAATAALGVDAGDMPSLAASGEVVMPMAAGSYTLTDGFGASRPGRSHMGQDFAAPVGTPIYAAMDGCVTISQEAYQGYGVTIGVAGVLDGTAVETLYSHLDYGTRAVEVGECVTAGQYLGQVGSTGYVFGSCLHFEVHLNAVAVDPRPWLAANVS